MARFLPSSSDPPSDADPRVIGVDSDDAGDLLAALSSHTARDILAALHESPAAPSEIAERADTTLQNAQYHIEKLVAADLIEVVDTVYSEKGREMKVYAPSDRPLVVFAGREEETSGLKAALSRLLGAVGLLAIGWFVLRRVLGSLFTMGSNSAGGGDSATVAQDAGNGGANVSLSATKGAAPEATETAAQGARETTATAVSHATTAAGSGGHDAVLASPALAFLAGAATVLVIWAAFRYYRG